MDQYQTSTDSPVPAPTPVSSPADLEIKRKVQALEDTTDDLRATVRRLQREVRRLSDTVNALALRRNG